MMKSWSRLGFLVIAISTLSSGQNNSTVAPLVEDRNQTAVDLSPTSETKNESIFHEMPSPTPPPPQSVSNESSTTPGETATIEKTEHEVTVKEVNVTETTPSRPTTDSTLVPGNEGQDDEAEATNKVAPPAPTDTTDDSSWGYVILAFIIVVIVILCIILYLLRRANRTYSFDLQRPVHVNHLNEPTGTFEPVYLDDLAPQDQETTDDLSPPPVANGTTPQAEEKNCNGENAAQEQPDANGLEASLTSNTSNTSPSPADEPADKTSSPFSSTNLLFDAIGDEQQNENNNNPSVYSSDPFVEINLDDPAWCDQLLTTPEAPSSVLPFSPFSFSSSSSSS